MKLTFTGDFAFPFDKDALKEIQSVKKITRTNIIIGNLESSTILGKRQRKPINIYSSEILKEFILNQGINIVSLANNHILDYGNEGFENLIEFLDKNSIRHFGAGMNILEASKALEIKHNGINWAFTAYAWTSTDAVPATMNNPGVAPLEKNFMIKNIKKLRKRNDEVCVICHWGYEYEKYPLPAHRKLAHSLVDAGATLVVGHHPHLMQGIEYYRGRMIAYSLGNFYLPLRFYAHFRDWENRLRNPGLIIKYNSEKPKHADLFVTEYNPETHALIIKPIDKPDLSRLKALSAPFELNDKEYFKFFKENKSRGKLLPVMKGDSSDVLRSLWLKTRNQGVKIIRAITDKL